MLGIPCALRKGPSINFLGPGKKGSFPRASAAGNPARKIYVYVVLFLI